MCIMLYHLNAMGQVVPCRLHCQEAHEHYAGKYASALAWFGVERMDDAENLLDRLKNLVVYHQLSGKVLPKLECELWDLLTRVQAERKWWAPPAGREENARKVLDWAGQAGLLMDALIVKSLRERPSRAGDQRLHAWEVWNRSG